MIRSGAKVNSYLLGSVGIVEQDLHSLGVQVLKGDMGDSMRLDVTVKDLKQVGTAACQDGTMSHQLMTTHLVKQRETTCTRSLLM